MLMTPVNIELWWTRPVTIRLLLDASEVFSQRNTTSPETVFYLYTVAGTKCPVNNFSGSVGTGVISSRPHRS